MERGEEEKLEKRSCDVIVCVVNATHEGCKKKERRALAELASVSRPKHVVRCSVRLQSELRQCDRRNFIGVYSEG